ncbi:MAG: tryptophan synthase subunit alpha [Deltaproteobacteria bacterium]|nr:tryptophan synthase subunit alpha [Deltaproteobacteria bacterium]
MSVLTKAIQSANREGRPARVPFLTAGCPSLTEFWIKLEELAQFGADLIEIGLPFSDPVADGPVIAEASQKALSLGVNLHWLLTGLEKTKIKVPLVLMSYANPLVKYAYTKSPGELLSVKITESIRSLAHDLKEVKFAGVIIPDIPLEESLPFRQGLSEEKLDLIALVGPNTSLERMREYNQIAQGYVYVVSVMGTTGVREGLSEEAESTLARAREVFTLPLALGFGLKEPQQLENLQVKPQAVIFGSALIRHLWAGKSVREFMEPWL